MNRKKDRIRKWDFQLYSPINVEIENSNSVIEQKLSHHH